jgi:hypothetical protein
MYFYIYKIKILLVFSPLGEPSRFPGLKGIGSGRARWRRLGIYYSLLNTAGSNKIDTL